MENSEKPEITNNQTPPAEAPTEAQATPVDNKSSKKTVFIILAIAGVVIIGLIVAIVFLLTNRSATTNQSSNTSSQPTSSNQETQSRKLVKSVDLVENMRLDIYEPEQSSNMTTFRMALVYACSGCTKVKGVNTEKSFDKLDKSKTYLLDDEAGKQYFPMLNADGDVLATKYRTWENFEPGQQLDIFVSFSRVPSGTTVSFVNGKLRVDGIVIP